MLKHRHGIAVFIAVSVTAIQGCTTRQNDVDGHAVVTGKTELRAGEPYFIPDSGFVRDANLAVQLAELYITSLYGSRHLHEQRPLTATLETGVWTVTGHLPPNFVGGVATVRIARSDGRIVQFYHGL